MRQDPGTEIELSAHCKVDHRNELGTDTAKYPFNAQTVLWHKVVHRPEGPFHRSSGRDLGVDHSEKNPNLCNV